MAKKKANEDVQLNPEETRILKYVLNHPDIIDQVAHAADPVQELGSLVDFDSLGIDPNAQYDLEDVLDFLDIGENWEGSGPQTAQSLLAKASNIPMMQDKHGGKRIKIPAKKNQKPRLAEGGVNNG